MRTELPCQLSSVPLQYTPQYVLDVQAWPPPSHPGVYSASPGTWMHQGNLTPPPAYPGGHIPAGRLQNTSAGHAVFPLSHLESLIVPFAVSQMADMKWPSCAGSSHPGYFRQLCL